MIDAPLYDGELEFNASLRTMAVVQDQHRTPERLEMKSTSISSEGPHSLSTLAPQEHWVAVEVKQTRAKYSCGISLEIRISRMASDCLRGSLTNELEGE